MKKLIILFLCYIPVLSWAALPFGATEAEKKMLPPVCQGKNKEIVSGLIYFNHYCYGENFINRSQNSLYPRGDRNYYLSAGASEIESAIERNNKKHPFMPVLLNRLAFIKEKQKKTDEAIALYKKSIKLNKNYVRTYYLLANLYKRKKDFKKAIEAINEGLKHNPDSKYLKKKLKRIEKKMRKYEKQKQTENKTSQNTLNQAE